MIKIVCKATAFLAATAVVCGGFLLSGAGMNVTEAAENQNTRSALAVDLENNNEKPRTIITNDGEVDDMDSMIRLMLYSNEMEIEGIILTSSQYHWAGSPDGVGGFSWPGTQWMEDILDGYEEAYPNLIKHAEGYPTPDYLRSVNKVGNIKEKGDMSEDSEGSNLIKECLLDTTDMRPVYIQTWGGTNTMARALKSIEEEYKGTEQWAEIQKRVYDKVIVYIILDQDETYNNYIKKNWPDIKVLKDPGNFWTFAYAWNGGDVPDVMKTGLKGSYIEKNIKFNHGKLLEGYYTWGDGHTIPNATWGFQHGWERTYQQNSGGIERYSFISEGDSPSFFYLLDNGLRNMEDPSYGGWGGRFQVTSNTEMTANVADYNPYQRRDLTNYTLVRWFDEIQADFAARADWCVSDEYSKANHRPTVEVEEGTDIIAAPGQEITLNAKASDPDKDELSYEWWQYYEADTYGGSRGEIVLNKSDDNRALMFQVPADAKKGETIHLIVEVKDNVDGRDNYMTHYQRVILTVDPAAKGLVNKTGLRKVIKNAVAEEDKDKYTEDSWKVYENALIHAKETEARTDATQEEVDTAEKVLADAQAALKEKEKPSAKLPYEDVAEEDWFYDGVYYNYVAKTMTGKDGTHFAPFENLARAQFAVIIHRMNGEPEVDRKSIFPDVEDDVWYTDAILWAAGTKVVTGYTDTGLFGPADHINREQIAVMMYRYASYLGYDISKKADFDTFEDAASVSTFANDAMRWAVGNGIITGKYNGTKIDPQGNALRSECAIIIQRFAQSQGKLGNTNKKSQQTSKVEEMKTVNALAITENENLNGVRIASKLDDKGQVVSIAPEAGDHSEGKHIVIWPYDVYEHHTWKGEKVGQNEIVFISKTGKSQCALAVTGNNIGDEVILKPTDESDETQVWIAEEAEDGYYRLKNKASGYYLSCMRVNEYSLYKDGDMRKYTVQADWWTNTSMHYCVQLPKGANCNDSQLWRLDYPER